MRRRESMFFVAVMLINNPAPWVATGPAGESRQVRWHFSSTQIILPSGRSTRYSSSKGEACGVCRKRRHADNTRRSEEHTSELQSRPHLVCRLLLEKKKNTEHGNDPPRQRRRRPCRLAFPPAERARSSDPDQRGRRPVGRPRRRLPASTRTCARGRR